MSKIACTLTPMCTRRFLLKLRIKNGLKIDDLPKFCYSIHKGVLQRYFYNKTVTYHPHDSYLYTIDFFDVYFHGDYRKLNKLIAFKNWEGAFKIFDERIYKRNENFKYSLTEEKNYLIFLFEERIHILYINENYAICNAKREEINSLELIHGLVSFYMGLNFPDILVHYVPKEKVKISAKIPREVIRKISDAPPLENGSNIDKYFWKDFMEDVETLSNICGEINLNFNYIGDLEIQLNLLSSSNSYIDNNKMPIRFRDLRLLFNFINRIYQDYYILHLEDYLVEKKS